MVNTLGTIRAVFAVTYDVCQMDRLLSGNGRAKLSDLVKQLTPFEIRKSDGTHLEILEKSWSLDPITRHEHLNRAVDDARLFGVGEFIGHVRNHARKQICFAQFVELIGGQGHVVDL